MNKKRIALISAMILTIISALIISIIIINHNKSEKAESSVEPHKIMHVYMPDLVGHMEESASSKLYGIGFYNVKFEYEKTGQSESGRVNRQSIPPNTTVGTDFEIVLYIEE